MAERLDDGRSSAALMASISAQADLGTEMIRISAVDTDPERAVATANAFAQAFVERWAEQVEDALAARFAIVEQEYEAVSGNPEVPYATRVGLRNQGQQLKAPRTRVPPTTSSSRRPLLQVSSSPRNPSGTSPSPSPWDSVWDSDLAFLLELLDRRIKDEEGLERQFGLPVIASMPSLGWRWRRSRKKTGLRTDVPIGFPSTGSPLLEPYRLLRSNLQFFDVDRRLRVLLVTSSLPQQGKSVTAISWPSPSP